MTPTHSKLVFATISTNQSATNQSMMNIKTEDLRPAMIWLWKKGKTQKEIAELFDVNRPTVVNAIKRYEEQGDFKDRQRTGRPVTTEARQEEMEALLNDDSHTRVHSTRKMAPKLRISRRSVQRLLKKAGYRSWKDQKRQALNEAQMQNRRERCPRLLERYFDCHDVDGLPVLFTDEKLFTVEQAHNRQNDRRWSRVAPEGYPCGSSSSEAEECNGVGSPRAQPQVSSRDSSPRSKDQR